MQAMLMCMSGHSRRNKIATSFTALCVCTCSRDCISYMIFAFFVSVSLLVSLYVFLGVSLCLCVALPPSLIPVCLSLLPSSLSLYICAHWTVCSYIQRQPSGKKLGFTVRKLCESHTHTHTHTTRLKFSWVGLSSWSSMVMSVHSSTGLISRVEAMWCQCTVLLGWSLKLKAASLVMSLYKSRYNTHIAQWHDIPIFRIFSLWVGFWGTTTMNTNTCNTKCSIVH